MGKPVEENQEMFSGYIRKQGNSNLGGKKGYLYFKFVSQIYNLVKNEFNILRP
jgi:hypothetical protein